jgi:hypothetical protein
MIAFTAAVIIPCSSELLAAPPEKEAGTYELTFLWSSPELILWAHIESASGNAPDGVCRFPVLLIQGITTQRHYTTR